MPTYVTTLLAQHKYHLLQSESLYGIVGAAQLAILQAEGHVEGLHKRGRRGRVGICCRDKLENARAAIADTTGK